MAVGTLVVLGLEQSSTDAVVAEGTAAARDHNGVREETLANATDEVVRDLWLLLHWRRGWFGLPGKWGE